MTRRSLGFALCLTMFVAACGGGGSKAPEQSAAVPASNAGVSLDKASYPVFPDADAGADPAVPAEQGGKGFTGEGWQTNTDFDLIGDPRAVKGGVFKQSHMSFPGTLRMFGPETTTLNQEIQKMVYEPLLGIHPTTLEYIPGLATHWQISPDRLTYRFRLNPNARYSTGAAVTSADVIASWRFATDKGLQEPQIRTMMEKFEEPVAESKYIIRVKAKELRFLNFYNLVQFMPIFPADSLKGLDGARYLKEYNFKLLPGSGPYILKEEDVQKGKSVSLRRRTDYWGEKQRSTIGTGNFDEIRMVVVLDQKLMFEQFKKGDLDYYYVNVSREWVEETNFDRVQRGVIQKRKFYTEAPANLQGMGFNLRRPPFDDVRVRKAIVLLLNRQLLIEKLFFNEYTPGTSYFPEGVYANPDNPKNEYDPVAAVKLLAEAGWSSRDAQGRLVKNGKPFVFEYLYPDKGLERWLTIYQEDLRKAGITMNLRYISFETMLQLQGEHKFDMVSVHWQIGTFPNPEAIYHSKFADELQSFNFVGFKNARVDELIDQYLREFDQQKRVAMMREIDGILARNYVYVLEWDAPAQRLLYLNKFGHPDSYVTRVGDYRDMSTMWWIDPVKEAAFRKGMADPSVKLEIGETDVRYWLDYAKKGGVAFEPPK